MELITLAIDLAVGGICYGLGAVTGLRKRSQRASTQEPRCTGYRFGRGAINSMRDDCTALRNPLCKDGRCSYHCSQMCKCEEIFK